ncbi:MAG: hypothetical protein ABIM89_18095 [Mycobacteriales bacterium]
MRNTRVRSLAVAAATILATLAWGTPANAIAARCMYPPSTPTLSVGLSATAPVAGQPVYVRGRMVYNRCGVDGVRVTVRVSGRTLGTPTTNATGDYSMRWIPVTKASTYTFGTFNKVAVKSRTLGIVVRTNLRGTTAVAVGRCRVTVKGSIYPVRTGRAIAIQRKLMNGTKFVGWTNVGTTLTTSSGAYGKTVTMPCGKSAGLSAYIGPTLTNAANRSATITVTARR